MGTSLFTFVAACILPGARAAAADYTIDSAHTVVSFELRSFGISRQRGRFSTALGSVSLDPQSGNGRFDIVIDARSIQAGSDAMEQIMRGKGLLNVEEYPTIAYKAQRVMFFDGGPARIEGQLTLLGVTRSVPLMVTGYCCTRTHSFFQQRCMVDATASFRRSEFGMTGYRVFASDKVRLAIRAEAVSADPGEVK